MGREGGGGGGRIRGFVWKIIGWRGKKEKKKIEKEKEKEREKRGEKEREKEKKMTYRFCKSRGGKP